MPWAIGFVVLALATGGASAQTPFLDGYRQQQEFNQMQQLRELQMLNEAGKILQRKQEMDFQRQQMEQQALEQQRLQEQQRQLVLQQQAMREQERLLEAQRLQLMERQAQQEQQRRAMLERQELEQLEQQRQEFEKRKRGKQGKQQQATQEQEKKRIDLLIQQMRDKQRKWELEKEAMKMEEHRERQGRVGATASGTNDGLVYCTERGARVWTDRSGCDPRYSIESK